MGRHEVEETRDSTVLTKVEPLTAHAPRREQLIRLRLNNASLSVSPSCMHGNAARMCSL
jgi:hypothetical protein